MNISMINFVEYELRYAEIQGDIIEASNDFVAMFPDDSEMELLQKLKYFLLDYEEGIKGTAKAHRD